MFLVVVFGGCGAPQLLNEACAVCLLPNLCFRDESLKIEDPPCADFALIRKKNFPCGVFGGCGAPQLLNEACAVCLLPNLCFRDESLKIEDPPCTDFTLIKKNLPCGVFGGCGAPQLLNEACTVCLLPNLCFRDESLKIEDPPCADFTLIKKNLPCGDVGGCGASQLLNEACTVCLLPNLCFRDESLKIEDPPCTDFTLIKKIFHVVILVVVVPPNYWMKPALCVFWQICVSEMKAWKLKTPLAQISPSSEKKTSMWCFWWLWCPPNYWMKPALCVFCQVVFQRWKLENWRPPLHRFHPHQKKSFCSIWLVNVPLSFPRCSICHIRCACSSSNRSPRPWWSWVVHHCPTSSGWAPAEFDSIAKSILQVVSWPASRSWSTWVTAGARDAGGACAQGVATPVRQQAVCRSLQDKKFGLRWEPRALQTPPSRQDHRFGPGSVQAELCPAQWKTRWVCQEQKERNALCLKVCQLHWTAMTNSFASEKLKRPERIPMVADFQAPKPWSLMSHPSVQILSHTKCTNLLKNRRYTDHVVKDSVVKWVSLFVLCLSNRLIVMFHGFWLLVSFHRVITVSISSGASSHSSNSDIVYSRFTTIISTTAQRLSDEQRAVIWHHDM